MEIENIKTYKEDLLDDIQVRTPTHVVIHSQQIRVYVSMLQFAHS